MSRHWKKTTTNLLKIMSTITLKWILKIHQEKRSCSGRVTIMWENVHNETGYKTVCIQYVWEKKMAELC